MRLNRPWLQSAAPRVRQRAVLICTLVLTGKQLFSCLSQAGPTDEEACMSSHECHHQHTLPLVSAAVYFLLTYAS